MKIILASASPRRRELLEGLGLHLMIRPALGEEHPEPGLSGGETAKRLSRAKCLEIAADADEDAVVIAADTVVCLDDEILGKPADEQDAKRMLRALSGRDHRVFTGVTVARGGRVLSDHEETAVHFRPLSEREIEAYIATGEAMDKAGAYGIQGRASLFVRAIEGDYFNVVGLPLCKLGQMLKELGVELI